MLAYSRINHLILKLLHFIVKGWLLNDIVVNMQLKYRTKQTYEISNNNIMCLNFEHNKITKTRLRKDYYFLLVYSISPKHEFQTIIKNCEQYTNYSGLRVHCISLLFFYV